MNIDVGKAIQELLYEHQVVIVPGLGGFTSAPQSANVDYVQGVVTPPNKKLEFNPNLVINDGVLVHHIQQTDTVTFQDAKDAIGRFVEDVKQALDQREIVEISHVGRLYKDYEHKIRFMPEGANFNPDTFGLPPVHFSPVVRERAPAVHEPRMTASAAAAVVDKPPVNASGKEPAATVPPVAEKESGGKWIQGMLPWLVLASAVVIALSIFLMFGGGDDNDAAIDKERLNVKPTQEEVTDAGQNEDSETAPGQNDPAAGEKGSTANSGGGNTAPGNKGKEENTSPAGSQQCLIIVHSFARKSNAVKFAQQLTYDGYSVETKVAGSLNRVGVTFSYNTRGQVDRMIKELADKYKAGPKVFGEEE